MPDFNTNIKRSRRNRIIIWAMVYLLIMAVFFYSFSSKGAAEMSAGFFFIVSLIAVSTGIIGFVVSAIMKKQKRRWVSVTGMGIGLLVISIVIAAFSGQHASETDVSRTDTGDASSVTPVTSGTLKLGESVFLDSKSIGADGGILSIVKPGDSLNGFKIEVPGGSYSKAANFKVSYSPVEKHTFGQLFNPLSPLITVENGGDYSESPMLVTIPVNVPKDEFAMAFFYDDKTGRLEGMPLVAAGENSLTVATSHFSSFIVSSVKRAILQNMAENIDTGFRPGVDDWQFPNLGSYITPGGQCAGQSLTALWYYHEIKSKGGKSLFNTYDNNGGKPTRDLWVDDTFGYRFASVLQNDISRPGSEFMIETSAQSGGTVYNAFAYSMLVTGQPQFIGVDASSGESGHAMVVYRVSPGMLWVADPNFPGKTNRTIPYVSGKLGPYYSGENANQGESISYDIFEYVSARALVDWDKLSSRWKEFEDGSIGSAEFPEYTLSVTDESGESFELEDGLTVDSKTVSIEVGADAPLMVSLYRDGSWAGLSEKGLTLRSVWSGVELEEGDNLIGIYVVGDSAGNPVKAEWAWVDFKWVNITYKPAPKPADLTGKWTGTGTYYQLDMVSGARVRKISVELSVNIKQVGRTIEMEMDYRAVGQEPQGLIKEAGYWLKELKDINSNYKITRMLDDPIPAGYVESTRWRIDLPSGWGASNDGGDTWTRWLNGTIDGGTISLELLGKGISPAGFEKWEFTVSPDLKSMSGAVKSIPGKISGGTYYAGRDSDMGAITLTRAK